MLPVGLSSRRAVQLALQWHDSWGPVPGYLIRALENQIELLRQEIQSLLGIIDAVEARIEWMRTLPEEISDSDQSLEPVSTLHLHIIIMLLDMSHTSH